MWLTLARVRFCEAGRSARIVPSLLTVPLPAIVALPILAAVIANPMRAVLIPIPVSLPTLIPLIAVGAFPLPLLAVPLPLSLLPLIPLIFFGSEQAGR